MKIAGKSYLIRIYNQDLDPNGSSNAEELINIQRVDVPAQPAFDYQTQTLTTLLDQSIQYLSGGPADRGVQRQQNQSNELMTRLEQDGHVDAYWWKYQPLHSKGQATTQKALELKDEVNRLRVELLQISDEDLPGMITDYEANRLLEGYREDINSTIDYKQAIRTTERQFFVNQRHNHQHQYRRVITKIRQSPHPEPVKQWLEKKAKDASRTLHRQLDLVRTKQVSILAYSDSKALSVGTTELNQYTNQYIMPTVNEANQQLTHVENIADNINHIRRYFSQTNSSLQRSHVFMHQLSNNLKGLQNPEHPKAQEYENLKNKLDQTYQQSTNFFNTIRDIPEDVTWKSLFRKISSFENKLAQLKEESHEFYLNEMKQATTFVSEQNALKRLHEGSYIQSTLLECARTPGFPEPYFRDALSKVKPRFDTDYQPTAHTDFYQEDIKKVHQQLLKKNEKPLSLLRQAIDWTAQVKEPVPQHEWSCPNITVTHQYDDGRVLLQINNNHPAPVAVYIYGERNNLLNNNLSGRIPVVSGEGQVLDIEVQSTPSSQLRFELVPMKFVEQKIFTVQRDWDKPVYFTTIQADEGAMSDAFDFVENPPTRFDQELNLNGCTEHEYRLGVTHD